MRVVRHGANGITHLSNPAATTLKRVECSWCRQPQGESEVEWSGAEVLVSHTICQSCLDERYPEDGA